MLVQAGFGQNNCDNPIFHFDFSGPGKNASISCGKIYNTSIWVVVKEIGEDTTTCWLWTEDIPLPEAYCSQPGNVTDVNIRMDMLGQTTPLGDFIRGIILCDGVTMLDDTIFGGDPGWPPRGSNVRLETYTVPCAYPSILKIYIQISSTDEQNGFKIFSGDACGASCYVPFILPVKLSPLKGSIIDKQAHFNIDVYSNGAGQPEVMLEISEDGRSFSDIIATAQADGETYHLVYKDHTNHYPFYRVKAMLDNGEVAYSNVVYLHSNDLPNPIVVTPNPAHLGETISIKGVDDITSAKLYNVQGGHTMDCTEYLQGTSLSGLLYLPSSLARGFYLVEVELAGYVSYRNLLLVQ